MQLAVILQNQAGVFIDRRINWHDIDFAVAGSGAAEASSPGRDELVKSAQIVRAAYALGASTATPTVDRQCPPECDHVFTFARN